MSHTHQITQSCQVGNRIVSNDNLYTGGSMTPVDEPIPDSSSDKLVVFTLDVSQVKSIYITSDQDLTVKTNDAGAPTDTLNLLADLPYIWTHNSYFTNKITADITALYVTNSSGAIANLKIEVVFDPTPT